MNSRGNLFDPMFGSSTAGALLSDRAWVEAMLEVESALARAAASAGVIDRAHCEAVEAAVVELKRPGGVDIADLGRAAAGGGNPVIPLVQLLRTQVGSHGAPTDAVHPGATSQDVLDTALMLLIRRACGVLLEELQELACRVAALAATHRETPMVARTLGQQALPSTFGLLAAGWMSGLDAAADRLRSALAGLPVQFGGAAGTLAALHPRGLEVADALARELGLAAQGLPWHTNRMPVAEVATAVGMVAGAVSKPATDIVILASTEIAELSEGAAGGSSAMPHKRNPIAAVTARAAARRCPGLVSTVLSTMDHELSRAAGPWHAEWETLSELMRCSAGAVHQLSTSIGGLQVHREAMTRNLGLSGGLIMAENVTRALTAHTDRAREIVTAAAATGRPLVKSPQITEFLTAAEVAELTDPARYLGHAMDLVDLALAAHESGREL